MKVLLTSDHNPIAVNGVVISTMNLKNELEKLGCEVRILCMSSSFRSYVEGDFYYVGSIPAPVYPGVRTSLNIWNPLVDQLIEWNPDIIHSQCEYSSYFFAKRIANSCDCPIVHTYHTLYEYYTQYAAGGFAKGLMFPFIRWRLKDTDVIIAPTDKTRESLRTRDIGNDIRVIPTGIDLSMHEKPITPEEREKIYLQWKIPEDAFLYGTVGRVAVEKNIHELLIVHKQFLKTHPEAILILVGDGKDRSHIEEEIDTLGIREHVRLTGMIEAKKVFKFYKILSIFVSASVSETQGLTYIEALANGVPVVARKDLAISGIVRDGINGYQYESEEQMLGYLNRLAEDAALRKALAAGAEAARHEFGTEVFGKRVYELYKEVVNREGFPEWREESEQHSLRSPAEILEERLEARFPSDEKKVKRIRRWVSIGSVLSIVIMVVLGVLAFQHGYFTDPEKMRALIERSGIWGPLIFMLLQVFQCLIPIIPGGVTLVLGVAIFGPVWGFVYNFVGIQIGEILAFVVARILGLTFVRSMVSEETFQKYIGWLDRNQTKFNRFFIIMILLPGMPDDFLCMVAGLSKMSFGYFVFNLMWAKAPTVLAYAFFMKPILWLQRYLFQLFL
ncbi:MAG: glycosyltransferase [Peptoniphilaceae bacterium]|nr:glycosyltransferase [Peptoniphilaceae bacterium]